MLTARKERRLLAVQKGAEQGWTAKEISTRYDIALSSVYRYLQELGHCPIKKVERQEEILQLLNEGKTQKEVLKEIPVSAFKIKKVMRLRKAADA